MPVRPPKADYEALITQGRQEFFDAMFSKESTATLISLMLEKIGKVDVKIGELLDFHTSFAEHHSAWNILKIAMYHNAEQEWFVSEFMERVDFDRFSIVQIEHKIKAYKSLIIKPHQTLLLEKMVVNWLESGILKHEIYHYDSYSMTSDFCHSLISLAYKFDYKLSETVLLDLTEAPGSCFGESQGKSNKCDYLSGHVSESKLKNRLAENINSGRIGNNLLRDHIQICSKLKYEVAVEAALSVCTSFCEDTLLRNVALNYLYSLHGAEYVEHAILPTADATFLLEISNVCKDISDYELSSAMEREFMKTPSLALMEALIERGSIIALEKYVSGVESCFHPPEYPEETGSEPTRAIRGINDPHVLPQLERLMKVVFSPEFVDNSFFSLKSSLQEAVINCGVNAPEKTLELLEAHGKNTANDNKKRFCTYAAKEIKRRRKNLSDKPLSIMEVKHIIS